MPEAPVTIVDTPPPSPPPAAKRAIPASSLPGSATPAPKPKPGSAREQMFGALRSKATDPGAPPTPKGQQTDPPAPAPAPEPPDSAEPPDPNQPPEPPDPAPPKPGTTPDPKAEKKNPWKLYESAKTQISTLQTEIAQLKEKLLPENDREEFTKRMSAAEQRAKALEDEIRFVNYEKSDEFKTKYQAPYEQAWARAMGELREIAIMDPATKQTREVTSEDLLTLVNMPLGQARQLADDVFGAFADDVMAHRKEIRNLFETRNAALAEAKEKGAEREKQRTEQFNELNKTIRSSITKTWETANQTVLKHERYGKYFAEVEGDEEGNQRLGKGYQLADRAFSDPSPTDPRLTAEKRADIIRRHAAVRNRAAAFGRLALWNTKLEQRLAAAEAELAQYKSSVPTPTSETRPPNGQPSSAREGVFGALRKLAKPS